jgi:hypothetical protein
MGILEMIIAFLGGAGGSWITRGLDMLQTWQDTRMAIKRDEARFTHEVELAKLAQTGDMAERESAREIAAMGADERAMTASYRHDADVRLSESAIAANPAAALWSQIYKTVTRPSLSHLVLIFIVVIWFTTDNGAIAETVTNGMLAAFAVIIGWWFGDRSRSMVDLMFGPGYIRRTRGVDSERVASVAGVASRPERADFPDLPERVDR